MVPINVTPSWDIIETPAGDVVITIAPGDRPRSVLVCADGIYVGTEGRPLLLFDSLRCAGVVGRARTVVVAEADEAIARETLVGVRVDARTFIKEIAHGGRRGTARAA